MIATDGGRARDDCEPPRIRRLLSIEYVPRALSNPSLDTISRRGPPELTANDNREPMPRALGARERAEDQHLILPVPAFGQHPPDVAVTP